MVHFREVQKFRQPWMIALCLGPLLVLAWGMWRQLVLKRPWGDRPAPDGVLVALGLGVLVLSLLEVLLQGQQYAVDVEDEREKRLKAAAGGSWCRPRPY